MRKSVLQPARNALSCAVAIGLSLSITTAHAIPIAWDVPSGDWFVAGNWVPAQVPVGSGGGTAGDDVVINNGGTAMADIATAPVGGIADSRTLGIGANGTSGPISGTLTSDQVEVKAAVGVSVGAAGSDVDNASGVLLIDGAQLNVSGASLNVGVVNAPNADAMADGSVLVMNGGIRSASGSIGAVFSNPIDGVISPMMTATGSVVADGDVVGGFRIGSNIGGGATSTAVGSLTINDGDLDPRGQRTVVGEVSGGDGSAEGHLLLSNGAFRLADPLNAGAFPPSLVIGRASGGNAIGTMQVAGMDMSGNALGELVVGAAGFFGTLAEVTSGGVAQGSLVSGGGDVAVTGDVSIGSVTANSGGSAIGSAAFGSDATVSGTGNAFSVGYAVDSGLFSNIGVGQATGTASAFGLAGFDVYRIGVTQGTIQDGLRSADGSLTIGTGGIAGNAAGTSALLIGAAQGVPNNFQLIGTGGTATGIVTVNGGDISGMGSVSVGISDGLTGTAGGHGSANGELSLHAGSLTSQSLLVGFANMRQAGVTVTSTVAQATGSFTMHDGVLTITDAFVGVSPGRFSVGGAQTFGDTSGAVSNLPASASGVATLTDVSVIGGALEVGTANQVFSDGDTSADGRLDVLRGGLDIASLRVGNAVGGVNSTAIGRVSLTDTHLNTVASLTVGSGGSADGELTAVDTDVAVGGDLVVGGFRTFIDPAAPLRGSLQMTNGALGVAGNATIGAVFPGGHGELLLDHVAATMDGRLTVGGSSNLGTLFGTGAVELRSGSLHVADEVFIDSGAVRLVDSVATFDGDLTMSRITGFGAEATAIGSLTLERSHVDVAGLFTIGVGDSLRLAFDNAVRGSGYGAMDVGSAGLNGGSLVLDFRAFTGVDPDYVFDLIVADAVGAISGDFNNLIVLGLDPYFQLTAGIEQDDAGNGLVDIYRVRLAMVVDAPPALLLLLPGGLLLALRGRAKCTAA